MSVQQFCLRWNNHQPNFISVCSSLLHNGTLVDVTLAAEGNQLQAHKIVLSACSSYFQSLFTMNPCQHPIVILKDVQYDHLRTMVDFMYYGEVNVSQDQLPHILKTAEMLKIKGLAEMPTDPANLIRSDSKSANDTTELVGTATSASTQTGNTTGVGGGTGNNNSGSGLVNSGNGGLSGTLWSSSESQFHAQQSQPQQQQQHQSQQSTQHQSQPQQHHQQLQQQQHHNQQQQHQQQLHTQLQNNQTQISQQQHHHQQQQQQQQQQHHHHHQQQLRRTPSPLGTGTSPAARRKRIRKSSNNGSGERNNTDSDQHTTALETGPAGGLTLSQMSQMSFGGGASTSGLSGLATHSLHTAKLLKESANNDMETHPQDSDSLDDTHGHVHIQIKPEVDITGIQQSIPLDISGATTPSEHDAPNTQSSHSDPECSGKKRKYNKNTEQDRALIIEAATQGNNWTKLAASLGIAYATAYRWIREGRHTFVKRGGTKPKLLSDIELKQLIEWLEETPTISIRLLGEKLKSTYDKDVSSGTIFNNLCGKVYTLNKYRPSDDMINSLDIKQERSVYVTDLCNYIYQGKQIIWLGVTNFNIFCRRIRACFSVPNPNVHVIAVMNSSFIDWEKYRRMCDVTHVKEWIQAMLLKWEEMGNRLWDLIIVCDENVPWIDTLEECLNCNQVTLLKLHKYSPMLNPLEQLWNQIKCFLSTHMKWDVTMVSDEKETKFTYLENMLDEALANITAEDCSNFVQQCTALYDKAIAKEDLILK